MYKAWKSQVFKCLHDMYQDVRHGRDIEHSWLQETQLQVLQEYCVSLNFQEKSGKNKANRASIKGGSLHTLARLPWQVWRPVW